jgi:hypothetical protein
LKKSSSSSVQSSSSSSRRRQQQQLQPVSLFLPFPIIKSTLFAIFSFASSLSSRSSVVG